MILLSVGLYAVLFLVLQAVEWLWAGRFGGRLLQWSSPAFCVGVPASVLGTAYVLTIRNPQNYTGFWSGIDELKSVWQTERRFQPSLPPEAITAAKARWADAIRRTLS